MGELESSFGVGMSLNNLTITAEPPGRQLSLVTHPGYEDRGSAISVSVTRAPRRRRREIGMDFLKRLRGRRDTAPIAPETVRCPSCGEENRANALICSMCRGALPPRPAQPEQPAHGPK